MVSSGLIKPKSSVDHSRLNLYYSKYVYRLTASIPGVQFFRYTYTLKSFRERLNYEVSPYTDYRLNRLNKPSFIPLKDLIEQSSPGSAAVIGELIQWRENNKGSGKNYTIRIYRDSVDFYTSDTDSLNDIYQKLKIYGISLKVKHVDFRQDWDKNSVYHKNPKNKLRVYLNFYRFEGPEIEEFHDFLESHALILCPSLRRSINERLKKFRTGGSSGPAHEYSVFVHNTHFFDIDDDYIITITALKYPLLIRKVSTIKQR